MSSAFRVDSPGGVDVESVSRSVMNGASRIGCQSVEQVICQFRRSLRVWAVLDLMRAAVGSEPHVGRPVNIRA
jgi:hypothetical protein